MTSSHTFVAALFALTNLIIAVGAIDEQPHAWWKEAVAYQVYPASFKETRTENAIGWGDINGITDKLDPIQDLGIDIVWLSPFYDSPMKDMGYDISNYDSVNQLFGGKIEDIKRFIHEVHKRGMRCIFDLVINHSSNQHPWFLASSSSKNNPYRDWYFWRPPQHINGKRYPPNNWAGNHNGSAWKYEPRTGEYYLNIFNPFQPNFNWDNPVTRRAILYVSMIYWLQMDIDGFRMDAFSFYSKTPGPPDVPSNNKSFLSGQYLYMDGPNEHKYLQQMHREVLSHYDAFTVGEYGVTFDMDTVQIYVGASRKEINSVFLTNMCDIGRDGFEFTPYNLTGWRAAVNFTQAVGSPAAGDGWNTVYLENHDLPRSISRFADDSSEYRVQGGKILSMMLSTLSGTLFLYQQQEIGMVNVPETWPISNYRDTYSLVYYQGIKEKGGNLTRALQQLSYLARDNARTPFNWNSTGGFSVNSTSWMPAAHYGINLADQVNDRESVYSFWKSMIKLRKQYKDLFIYGAFEILDWESERFFIYQKTSNARKAIVILNLSGHAGKPSVDVPSSAEVVAYTHKISGTTFEPWEGRVYVMSV